MRSDDPAAHGTALSPAHGGAFSVAHGTASSVAAVTTVPVPDPVAPRVGAAEAARALATGSRA
ncbi:hypothetical protein PV371_33365 [Streptomyces sp. TX20-6-3]|uniref:hypothetical protein n=1 Tax=Streptomyces sp. TX20-6-3 TaxID=3028705 RepID=UPI0029ABF66E|nr:hypothetical protein [Streptomyces sp. TX20-6-3]MDX2564516.1 hypothetical protein [Streptomyces sp. TX20-6-3]